MSLSADLTPKAQLEAHFRAQAEAEDLTLLDSPRPDELAEAIWDLVDAADGARAEVRVRPTGSKTADSAASVLECVGPDMPFLVDSVLNAVTGMGLEVLALFHPILERKDAPPLSAIQVHLPRISKAQAEALTAEVEATLADVALAVADYAPLQAAMRLELDRLKREKHLSEEIRSESTAFLDWLVGRHFVFLGKRTYSFPADADGRPIAEEPEMVEGSNLGLLRDEALNVLNRSSEPTVLRPEIGAFVARQEPIIIAKSTLTSRVHRRVAADYVGIKHYDSKGRVAGETRFLGLFTAAAYDETARSIPLVRKRVEKILANIGANPGSHDAKALSNILEKWPRDELLQSTAETLTPMVQGALGLIGRPRARVFLRFDEFDRFATALVYVPREAYDTRLRMALSEALENALQGKVSDFEPRFDTSALVRVVFHVQIKPGQPRPDQAALERTVADLARTWDDAFSEALTQAEMDGLAAAEAGAFRNAFNAAYREAFPAEEALRDIREMAALSASETVRVRAYKEAEDDANVLRAKIYVRDGSIALSRCVPVFENMGLFVNFETGFPVHPSQKLAPDGPETYWVHDLKMRRPSGDETPMEEVSARFEQAFVAVWTGRTENDGYNQLVVTAGADWRDAALLRGLCAFRHQTGRDPGRATQIEALRRHPKLTGKLLDLFDARFNPELGTNLEARGARCVEIRAEIEAGLASVSALDDDRVIRRLADLILALVRTNFFQCAPSGEVREAISFKIASGEVEVLPEPKPYREIFVAGPAVEGVHCRFGAVARGGIRWSDRRDDFRTEVLGLVKAQQVKNAVIVPVGSKGGFYPKLKPAEDTREAVRQAAIGAYRIFIGSLLDLTDTLVDGEIRPPEDTVIWDGEDPYLVVAADKGTASFSDIANEISEAHGFWLGDAFASGGSAGYDHKAMGITARGGWEAVKRHFRE
ncbi:MAG: NAD-glutamate dehydrogenase domain-containing protein, partial [Pseudomonadota bacterium]